MRFTDRAKKILVVTALGAASLGASRSINPEMRTGVLPKSLGIFNIDNTPGPEYIEYEAQPPRPDRKGRYDPVDLKYPTRKTNTLRIYKVTTEKTEKSTRYDPKSQQFLEPYKTFQWFSDAVDGYSVSDVTNDGIPDIILKYGSKGCVITFCSKRKYLEMRDISNIGFTSDTTMALTLPAHRDD